MAPQEDAKCRGVTEPTHDYRARALEPGSHNCRSCAATTATTGLPAESLCSETRRHRSEKPEHCTRESSRKARTSQHRQKLKRRKKTNVNWYKPFPEPALGLRRPSSFQTGSCFQGTPVCISMPTPDPGGYRRYLAKLGSYVYSTLSTMIGEK